ncbi:class I adenylate-forming enzyme family protein [Paenarthrobacter sp. NPDC089989]|uniref:class I adenylate-forming enzyme family protein n=1 Tax=unclassified Paenarthrobacter TaxID=2634190 RepID=UPI0037F24F33
MGVVEAVNLAKIVEDKVDDDRIAVTDAEVSISYRQLNRLADELSQTILDVAGPKDRTVGIALKNSCGFIVTYLAVQKAGLVAVPMGPGLTSSEIQREAEYSDLSVLIVATDAAAGYAELLYGLSFGVDVLGLELTGSLKLGLRRIRSNARERRTPSLDLHRANSGNDVAVMLHTSGSVSKPKRVMLTHLNLIENARSVITSLGLTARDCTAVALPLYFGYAHTAQMIAHLIVGARIVILPNPFTPMMLMKYVRRFEVTNFTAVPSTMAIMARSHASFYADAHSLRFICYGGAVTAARDLDELKSRLPQVDFMQTYGQTEASPRLTLSSSRDPHALSNPTSVGLPISGVRIDVLADNGQPCVPFEIGEVVASGRNIMKGYYRRPEETAKVLRGGVLLTGDLGYKDEQGYLYLLGRLSNVIISGGINLYPEEIEEALDQHPGVALARVSSQPHEILGAVPVAEVMLDPGTSIDTAQLFSHCRRVLSRNKVPTEIKVVANIERTFNGKTKRQ